MLLDFLMNRASNVASVLLNAHKHHYAKPHFIFSKSVSMSSPSLFILYLCDLYFIFSLIFIVINHITSLKQTDTLFSCIVFTIFLEHYFWMITWVLLNFCLFFCQFQPGVTYKKCCLIYINIIYWDTFYIYYICAHV